MQDVDIMKEKYLEVKTNNQKNSDSRDHIEMLHKIAAHFGCRGRLVVAGFGQDPATGRDIRPKCKHFAIGDVDGGMKFIGEIQNDEHRNTYMPLASYPPSMKQGAKGEEKNIELVFGLCADYDDDQAHKYSAADSGRPRNPS